MLGKLIGALVGLWTGGFLGLLIGLFLGHLFDRHFVRLAGGYLFSSLAKHQVQVQRIFFEATFTVMGHVAKADGRVSEQEIALARQVMQRLGLNETATREAMELFGRGKQPDFDLEGMLQTLRSVSHGRLNLIQMFIEIQLGAGFADGKLDTVERDLLVRICTLLGYPLAAFERLEAMIQAELHYQQGGRDTGPSLKDSYAILNIDDTASDAEVKRAYRRLTSQHHPDKLAAKGLPKEMMKLAEQKTHEIRTAYEKIREARGFK